MLMFLFVTNLWNGSNPTLYLLIYQKLDPYPYFLTEIEMEGYPLLCTMEHLVKLIKVYRKFKGSGR